jgi:hypothetical protein
LFKHIGGYVWNLYRYTNGAPTDLGGWSAGPPSEGDRMMLRRVGGQLQAWYYTVSNQTWTLKVSATDSTYVNGHIGAQIIDGGFGGVPILDDFGGTDVVTGPPHEEALPATPVLDHFNRAPEDPLSQSGNWASTNPAGSGAATLEVANLLGRNLDSNGEMRSYRTTEYSGYVEAYFTIAAMPGNGLWFELLMNLRDVGRRGGTDTG